MDDLSVTPRFTGAQPPAEQPTCGTSPPSAPGARCGAAAAWHIRWDPGPDPIAGLACQPHMDQLGRHHTWYARHPAGPACSSPAPTWHETHCTA